MDFKSACNALHHRLGHKETFSEERQAISQQKMFHFFLLIQSHRQTLDLIKFLSKIVKKRNLQYLQSYRERKL